MFDFLNKLSFNKTVSIIIVVWANLITPYLFLLNYDPDRFYPAELLKALIISMSIGIPGSLLLLLLFIIPRHRKRQHEISEPVIPDDKIADVVKASILNAILFYAVILVNYFAGPFQKKDLVLFLLLGYGILLFYIVIEVVVRTSRSSNKINPN